MDKCRRRRANLSMPRIFVRRSHDKVPSLPEEVIQHIQSFLGGKKAAQTMILSKSWYNAWFSRPNLDFNQRDFTYNNQNRGYLFWRVARKMMQRYEESNLKIESFKFFMLIHSPSDVIRLDPSIEELVVKAMKMGLPDFEFGIESFNREGLQSTTLPRVVLECETLIRLSVVGIEWDSWQNRSLGCSRLKSLSLDRVGFADGHIIYDVISSCPLIEKLALSKCLEGRRRMRLGPRSLYGLCKLKSLFLVEVDVDPLFFSQALPNFACLKDLSFENCGVFEFIRLSSPSLKYITFTQQRDFSGRFDIPNILNFKYSGPGWPSVSFTKKTGWRKLTNFEITEATSQNPKEYRYHWRWVPEPRGFIQKMRWVVFRTYICFHG